MQLTFPWRCTKRTDMNRCRRDGERERESEREREKDTDISHTELAA